MEIPVGDLAVVVLVAYFVREVVVVISFAIEKVIYQAVEYSKYELTANGNDISFSSLSILTQ
jgi:hypothetical protein